MKLIVLLFGLALGFGGGVWWGVHHPDEAADLSAKEEAEFIKTAQATKAKLDQLIANQHVAAAAPKLPGGFGSSGFVGGGASAASPAPDPELQKLSQQMQSQLDSLQAHAHK